MARIALVNAPFRSHVAAMMRLADVLVRQGHELIVWAPEEWRAAVEQLGARFEPSVARDPAALAVLPLAAALASITGAGGRASDPAAARPRCRRPDS